MKAGVCRYNITIGYRHTSSRHPLLLHKPSTQAATVTWRTHSANLGSGLCTLSQCRFRHLFNTAYQPPCVRLLHVAPCGSLKVISHQLINVAPSSSRRVLSHQPLHVAPCKSLRVFSGKPLRIPDKGFWPSQVISKSCKPASIVAITKAIAWS